VAVSPAPESPEHRAAIAAFESIAVLPAEHLRIAGATIRATVLPGGIDCGISGTRAISIDGVAAGGVAPAGRQHLEARFDRCRSAGPLNDVELSGAVRMTYEAWAQDNVTADLTMQGFALHVIPDYSVVGDGPVGYRQEESALMYREQIDFFPGAALWNPVTKRRVDFIGGRYATGGSRRDGASGAATGYEEYEQVTLDVNGVRHVIDGRIVWIDPDLRTSHCSGQVRVTDGNGNFVARRYCERGVQKHELLKPLPSLG
jgi:hypothetical protein